MSRRQNQQYFRNTGTDPKPLVCTTHRRVRFEEVDPLMIVWHGRYPSYLEDGRAAFGENYNITYMNMYDEKFLAPVVTMHIEYHQPLTFPEEFKIVTSLHWTDAVKMNFSYKLLNRRNQIVASAYTVQILTDLNKEVMLIRPAYIEDFCRRWKDGLLK